MWPKAMMEIFILPILEVRWSVNTNGSIQVIRPSDKELQEKRKSPRQLMADGFDHRSLVELVWIFRTFRSKEFVNHAQFAMVEKGEDAISKFNRYFGGQRIFSLCKASFYLGSGSISEERSFRIGVTDN